MKKGDRIGAIVGADKETDTVLVLGYGVYQGEEVPPPDGGWIAEMLHEGGVENPKLLLDSGEIVYGCQCWWGSEETVKGKVARYIENGWSIHTTTLAEALEKANEEGEIK